MPRDDFEALSNDDKAVYGVTQIAVAIEVLERRIERRLSEFRQRLTVTEQQVINMEKTSQRDSDRLRRLEIFFWVMLGLGIGNAGIGIAGVLAIVEKLK